MTASNYANQRGMIYVHVPFCASRCIYCDFFSTTQTDEWKQRYVEAACRELTIRATELSHAVIASIYIGGGTPSQLRSDQIQAILEKIYEKYRVDEKAEITLEANPDDVTKEFVSNIRRMGINRVSLGVQSFDDELLKLLNRRHNALGAVNAVKTLVEGGVDNVSIDLIYGLPQQTEKMFALDLRKAFSLPIRHLSSYALSIEHDTMIARMLQRGDISLPTEETSVREYNMLMSAAEAHGFEHYEISNFALPHFHSLHNSGYWNGMPYIGIGPGAHSFHDNVRRHNLPNLIQYADSDGYPPYEEEILTIDEQYDEFVFTSLRTKKGLSLQRLSEIFGPTALNYLLKNAKPHLLNHRLIHEDGFLSIAKESIMISDDIMSDLMKG